MSAIAALWRYPVKTMGGERHQALAIAARGVVDDRRWALHTPDGRIVSGKATRRFHRVDGLLQWTATLDQGQLVIITPDGDRLHGDDPQVDAALSRRLGEPVTLEADDDAAHFDRAPIHVLTTASLRWLRRLLPEGVVDERRFRPNVLVDVAGDSPVEADWVGRELLLGAGVVLRVREMTERCVMTTLEQSGLPKDPQVLRAIARHADARFGVYADVVRGGTISFADACVVGA